MLKSETITYPWLGCLIWNQSRSQGSQYRRNNSSKKKKQNLNECSYQKRFILALYSRVGNSQWIHDNKRWAHYCEACLTSRVLISSLTLSYKRSCTAGNQRLTQTTSGCCCSLSFLLHFSSFNDFWFFAAKVAQPTTQIVKNEQAVHFCRAMKAVAATSLR